MNHELLTNKKNIKSEKYQIRKISNQKNIKSEKYQQVNCMKRIYFIFPRFRSEDQNVITEVIHSLTAHVLRYYLM